MISDNHDKLILYGRIDVVLSPHLRISCKSQFIRNSFLVSLCGFPLHKEMEPFSSKQRVGLRLSVGMRCSKADWYIVQRDFRLVPKDGIQASPCIHRKDLLFRGGVIHGILIYPKPTPFACNKLFREYT